MTVAAKESLPEQSAQSLQALHSLLVAAALSTKCARVSLVTPECACFASSDEELSRGRRYSPGENDITYDMRYEERLLGNLVFERPPKAIDHGSLAAFADAVSLVMGQAADLEEATRAVEQAQVLGDLAGVVGGHYELEPTLISIVRSFRHLMRADYASLATLDPDGTTRWVAMDGHHTDTYKQVAFPPGKGIAARAIAAGGPVFLENFGRVPDLPAEEFPIQMAEGGVSTLGVPLMVRGRPLGALIVGSRTPRGWRESEVKLATLLANGAALLIHEVRASEQEKSQQAILEKMVESFPGVLLVMGPPPASRILFASKQFQRFVKEPYRSGASVAGLGAEDLSHEQPERSRAFRDAFAQVYETGESISFERYESIDPDGDKMWWNWSIVPIGDKESGEQRYIMLIATDVTEPVRAQHNEAQAAREARIKAEELEAVISQMVDGVVIFDRAGEVARINPEGMRLMGRGVAEGSGPERHSEIYGLCDLDGEPYDVEHLPSTRALRGQTVVNEQVLVKRPNGEEMIVSANVSPLVDAHGNIYGAVGVFHDITQDKLLEKLKDDFLSVVSHELRTPLTAIMGHTDLMLRGIHGGLSDRQARALRATRANANRLLRLINDVLDISKLEAGSVQLHPAPVDLGDVISRTITETRVLVSEAGVRVYNHVPSRPLPRVVADDMRLQQVLENLLSNAIKFTPEGGRVEFDATLSDLPPVDPAHVQISTSEGAPGRGPAKSVVATVRDSGAGIPADQLDLIWERFYQVDSTAKRRAGGAGLGLAIVRNLVELHGGRVWAWSEGLDKGSTFSFTLPLAPEEVEADSPQAETPHH